MKLWLQRSNGERQQLGEFEVEQEATKAMFEFCRERNFHVYYTRVWTENSEKWFDVGSWTEYFIITDFENGTGEV